MVITIFIILALISPGLGIGFIFAYFIFASIALLLKPWLDP